MKKGYVIAVVGSGGKTTLIETIARQAKNSGKKVVVMTTTHMRLPERDSAVGRPLEEAAKQMEREGLIYYGVYGDEEGKMGYPGREAYERLCERADVVLVEADGSRRLPMKAPDWSREPVIPVNADMVLVVFGLSALGRPLKEVCHRWRLGLPWILDTQGQAPKEPGCSLVTEDMAAEFLEKGYLKAIRTRYPDAGLVTLLNQADGKAAQEKGERIRKGLAQKGYAAQVICLRQMTLSVIYLASGFGKRFGKNKLLEILEGKPLFAHGLGTILKLRAYLEAEMGIRTRVVLVSQYPEILDFGKEMGVEVVENPCAAEGITASIRLGTEAAGENEDYYLYAVADQPWLRWETVAGLIQHFLPRTYSDQVSIGCLACGKRRGNPVIFHKRHRAELLTLKGDRGGSQLIKRYPEEVMEYPAEAGELVDIDTPV